MEFLRTPDPGASGLWANVGNGSNGSSVTSAAVGIDHGNSASLDRAGIKSSFQTLFSPNVATTPAILSRGQTIPGLTPFIGGGATPNLITPALGMLPGGPSPRLELSAQNGAMRSLPTPDMMRSPFLQEVAKEAVRREFLNMPSFIGATDISAASEQTVPGGEFASAQVEGQHKLVFAKDGAPVPPNTMSAYSKPNASGLGPQTPPLENNLEILGSDRVESRTTNDASTLRVAEQRQSAANMNLHSGRSAADAHAAKSPSVHSSESNQRVPNGNASLHTANSHSQGRDSSSTRPVPSQSEGRSQSQSQQHHEQPPSQRVQQYPQPQMAPFPVNQAELHGQPRPPFPAFNPSGRPPYGAVQGPSGMFLMGQPPVMMTAHPAPGAPLFAHPSGALMMFAPSGAAPHTVMQPHPGMLMHPGHQGHIMHPSAAQVKPESVSERKERVEREKQELIREFKKKTREAALVRFRQKRRERRFGKLIRYDCRKKLADARPRVKGRFVRIRSDDLDEDEEEFDQAQVVPSLDE